MKRCVDFVYKLICKNKNKQHKKSEKKTEPQNNNNNNNNNNPKTTTITTTKTKTCTYTPYMHTKPFDLYLYGICLWQIVWLLSGEKPLSFEIYRFVFTNNSQLKIQVISYWKKSSRVISCHGNHHILGSIYLFNGISTFVSHIKSMPESGFSLSIYLSVVMLTKERHWERKKVDRKTHIYIYIYMCIQVTETRYKWTWLNSS